MRWFWQRDKTPKPTPTIPEGAIRRKLRYTAQSWARQRGLTGWVTNLTGGDVMLEVQGTPEQVEGFMGDVAAESARNGAFIRARLVQCDQVDPVPEDRFVIRNVNF